MKYINLLFLCLFTITLHSCELYKYDSQNFDIRIIKNLMDKDYGFDDDLSETKEALKAVFEFLSKANLDNDILNIIYAYLSKQAYKGFVPILELAREYYTDETEENKKKLYYIKSLVKFITKNNTEKQRWIDLSLYDSAKNNDKKDMLFLIDCGASMTSIKNKNGIAAFEYTRKITNNINKEPERE